MSEDKTPEGPDFSQGVPAADIAEGEMLAGRVGDEAVLIARVDGALHAIGAECTHYKGPLAEGLIVDGAVRCPWHHACFDLKTGEATAAPAFDPVACWTVEERDGKAFVTGKKPPAQPVQTPGGGGKRVVIVGGGAAGFAAAEMLRRRGFEGALSLISADPDAPYDRPNCSKDYLAGTASAEWMPLKDAAFYRDQKLDLKTGVTVKRFDPKAKLVHLEGGQSQPYDILILATGAEPQRPDIPGLDGPNVHLLRTLKDAEGLIAAAEKAKRVAVIGASFIGLEAAASLKQRGLEVDVIAPETVLFEKILGREVGDWIKSVHEAKGVTFHLGRKALGYADGKLTLDQGDPIPADLVVVGTGVKPRVALAEAAGLKVDNGVVVDDHLKTSADGVYAIGDIARYPDPISGAPIRVEHWAHAEWQGQYVARLILGEEGPYDAPPYFWSLHYDKSISYTGHAEDFDPPQVDGSLDQEDATVTYSKAGKLLAIATSNRDRANLEAEAAFEAET
jgi:NADPH-dependent 2,4-dienoyl-CoA reductase/sulfur reductase-like enzyme/nitrite reductase/ring-hydroxylating ferredoxin subunit